MNKKGAMHHAIHDIYPMQAMRFRDDYDAAKRKQRHILRVPALCGTPALRRFTKPRRIADGLVYHHIQQNIIRRRLCRLKGGNTMKTTTRSRMHSALKNFPAPKTSAAKPRGPYSKSELDEFKTAMEEMAEQIRHDIRTHKRILDVETQSKEEENEAAYFLNRQTELLRHVEAALARIRMGVFGVCVSCGTRIEKERMLAVPHTQLCVDCKKKGRSARHIVSLSNAR